MGAAPFAARVRDAMARQFKISTRLRTDRYLHGNYAVDCLNVDFSTECRINHTDMFLAKNQIALAGKLLMRFNANIDV